MATRIGRPPGSGVTPVPERFWAKVHVTDGCWEWQASTRQSGYGQFYVPGPNGEKLMEQAHRVSYMLTFGDIPDGLHVCHACDNPLCVNPDHLWLGTRNDNMQDMARKGRARKRDPNKTACIWGHEFTEENTYHAPDGGRTCRTCYRAYDRDRQRRRRARSN